ncbi:MAG: hypothetical protein AAGA67_10300 [Cyanobacteria bacterium P01_F01_bin.153]
MSYEMWFWKQSEDCCLTPSEVLERLNEGQELKGLLELNLDAIKERVKRDFPEFNGQIFVAEEQKHYFTIDVYPPFVFQIISHPPSSDAEVNMLNNVIDIALEFGCALYAPQSGERYQQGK